MLPKSRRISKEEFSSILKSGKRYTSAHFVMYVAQNKANLTKPSQFSFSISKKVASSAVERNKLRRRGYSALRKLLGGVKSGYLLMFSFKNKSVSVTSLEKELSELLSASAVLL